MAYYSEILVTVVVPVYNQEKNVSTALANIKDVLHSSGLSKYEIITVNDGSTDDTFQALQKEKDRDPHVRVISYTPNRGKGYAVKRGIMQSRGNVVMFLDGDLNISPSVIREYVATTERSNLVIASKRHPNSRVKVPVSRRFCSILFNIMVQIIIGLHVHDTQAGLKVGDGEIMRAIFREVKVNRYAFDVELLAVASVLKLNIQEMPVNLTIDRRFKVKDIARMFLDVLAVTYRYRLAHVYQKELAIGTTYAQDHPVQLAHHASAEA